MDNFMRGILSRVLSEELANQVYWSQKELDEFDIPMVDRESNIKNIKKFMQDNDIEYRSDFYYDKLGQLRRELK